MKTVPYKHYALIRYDIGHIFSKFVYFCKKKKKITIRHKKANGLDKLIIANALKITCTTQIFTTQFQYSMKRVVSIFFDKNKQDTHFQIYYL